MYEYYDYDKNPEKARLEEARRRAEAQKKAEKKAKRRKFWGAVLLALVFGLVAGGAFIGINYLNDFLSGGTSISAEDRTRDRVTEKDNKSEKPQKDDAEETKRDTDTEEDEQEETEKKEKSSPVTINKSQGVVSAQTELNNGNSSVSEVAKETMPSIVAITNKSLQEVRMMFSYETQVFESESEGSGIIIGQNDSELLILTNHHVIDGAETLTVRFIDEEACEATLKGSDSGLDVAVISVKLDDLKQSTRDAIKIALIGDSDTLEIGEQVVAIGNALGYGQSVTTGIVSALNREIESSGLEGGLIQTDAAINPGNSGGALLNMRGEVIGINSAKLSDTTVEGMCYAIPISTAIPTAETLMNRETRDEVPEDEAGYMGIVGVLITRGDAEKYSMPEGIYLQQIIEDTAAEEAGLKVGDIIEKFDGITINSVSELQDTMKYYRAGEEVELVIYRQDDGEYKEKEITITLGKRVDEN